VNAAGEAVASSDSWDGRATGEPRVARAPVGSGGNDTASEGEAEEGTLGELKALWGEASEEERRTFLRWAFE
jgi:hypothetical protein